MHSLLNYCGIEMTFWLSILIGCIVGIVAISLQIFENKYGKK